MIKVRKVRALEDHRLELEFSDGTRGVADVSRLFERYPALHPLREAKRFMRAYVEHGAVAWPGDIDIAPESLYALAHKLPSPDTLERAKTNELEMSLRELRQLAGKTQAELADVAGLTQGALSQVERQEDWRLSTVRKYVQALGGELRVVAVLGDKQIVLRGV
jgi:DNA-binding XRE family transcriptional regulator